MLHKYPKDLVVELMRLWKKRESGCKDDSPLKRLPGMDILEAIVSTCYQVSQMREEARKLHFRLMLCEPEDVDLVSRGEAHGLFCLCFTKPRHYNEYELLKLSPSVDYKNSLIGIRHTDTGGLQIWGLIHSGSRWMHVIHGGSKQPAPLPDALGVNVVGSGRINVCRGLEILAQLTGGNIISPSANVLQSQWVARRFQRIQTTLSILHAQNAQQANEPWAQIDASFVPSLYLEFFKHVISTMRSSEHGGAIISFPKEKAGMISRNNPYIDLKYSFVGDGARNQLRSIVLEIMAVLARSCGRRYGAEYKAGWRDYVRLQSEELMQLDERVFKIARFIARLTGVDGAVVTSNDWEIVGFGSIIQGTMEMGGKVARALDVEGERRQIERVENVGTRHRSLYYLCNRLQDALGIIVSQDAKARVVTWKRDMVTCWDVIPIDFS